MKDKLKLWDINLIKKSSKKHGHIQLSNSLVELHRRTNYWPCHWLFIMILKTNK